MEFIRWVFGYLFFHRKVIVGALLLIALVYWLANSKSLIKRFSGTWGQQKEIDSQREPEPEVTAVSSTTKDVVEPESEDEQNQGSVRDERSAEKLVEKMLENGGKWANETHAVAYMMIGENKQMARQLMQMELSSAKQKFAKISYIEALSVLDSLNVQGKINDPVARPQMLEQVKAFLDDPDQDVQSLASLVLAVYPGYDFIVTPSQENFSAFQQSFDRYVDGVQLKAENARKLAEVVVRIRKLDESDDRTRAFADAALDRYKLDTSEEGKLTYAIFEEQLNFGVLDLVSLVDRMQRRDPTTEDHIVKFREALVRLPDSRIEIYQVAMDIIREYIKLDKRQPAIDFIQELEADVLPKIADGEKKKKIREALDQFKPFL